MALHGDQETRFSRQASLLGEDGMKSISNSIVLLHGLNGVGIEIGMRVRGCFNY